MKGVWGLGLRDCVQGVWGSVLRDCVKGSRILGFKRFRVQEGGVKQYRVAEERQRLPLDHPVLGFRVLGFGFWVSGFRFRVSGFGFRVSGFGSRHSGFGSQERQRLPLD